MSGRAMTKHLCLTPGQGREQRESFPWLMALVLVIVGLPVVLYVATREELDQPVGFASIENLEKAVKLDLPPHTQLVQSSLDIAPGELIVLAELRLATTELALLWERAHLEPRPCTAEDLRFFRSWWHRGVLPQAGLRSDKQMLYGTSRDTETWESLEVLAMLDGSGWTTIYLVSVR